MSEGPKESFDFEEWAKTKLDMNSIVIPGIDPRTVYNTPKKVENLLQPNETSE